MKKILQILIFLFIVNKILNGQTITNYEINLKIEPSFISYCIIDIAKNNDKYIFNMNNISDTILSNNLNKILSNYYNNIENIIKTYKYNNYPPITIDSTGNITGMWTDGTMTYGTIIINDTIRRFSFYSGNIDSSQIELMDNIFNIAFNLYDTALAKGKITFIDYGYLTDIERTVCNTAIRKVTDNPIRYRFYDRVYDFQFDRIKYLLEKFPINKPILIETGPYFAVKYDKLFETFLPDYFKKRENIYWILTENCKAKLIQLGLKNKYILNSYSDFIKLSK